MKLAIVNSGEFGARSDGATPISNRRATSDNVPNFSSIDYIWMLRRVYTPLAMTYRCAYEFAVILIGLAIKDKLINLKFFDN
ncbi:palindromic element RPE2 domain-containing protein [Candidatus Tisiphia endosymbiont of Ptychoptera albimana]|uniref:palindromic element RPE2 domain-containing protein n=1 Tax=Candidatus Tisiphia endosymbiont of Ptychoptera albimana TaxID=3066260 RepID=UPI001E05C3AF|nr:palindromic element RPE2 domain-containing protein [Rickettsia endosymbiont of Sericostoma sp. HW-2014]